jgi:hypothetical protein
MGDRSTAAPHGRSATGLGDEHGDGAGTIGVVDVGERRIVRSTRVVQLVEHGATCAVEQAAHVTGHGPERNGDTEGASPPPAGLLPIDDHRATVEHRGDIITPHAGRGRDGAWPRRCSSELIDPPAV